MEATDPYTTFKDFHRHSSRVPYSGTCATEIVYIHRFIKLAARFVSAIEKAGGGDELHEQAMLFYNLTGEGSRYDKYRRISYDSSSKFG